MFNAKTVALGIGGFILAVVLFTGLVTVSKEFNRYQARAEADNQVKINSIIIRQQEQRVLIEQQDAQVRIEEAYGIAESQRIIDESLSEDYLTYLAIQAQMEMSENPNNTTVYIPSGPNGIPLVRGVE